MPVWAFALVLLFSGLSSVFAAGSPNSAALPKVRIARDGRTFEVENGKPFVPFGVSYFRPGTGWAPQLWKKFDAEATRVDFDRLQELGVNCVRVFLTFGSFYAEPGKLSSEGLEKFDQFLALAEAHGIYVHPTGPDHWEQLPDWAKGDRYTDETLLQAQESFWRLLAARYRGRRMIFAYDLLNEPEISWNRPGMQPRWKEWLQKHYGSLEKLAETWQMKADLLDWGSIAVPFPNDAPGDRRLLDYQHFREELADEWTRRQVAAIKAADPSALVTVGLIQWSVPAIFGSVSQYSGFRPSRQAAFLDFLEIHFYPLAQGFYEYSGTDAETRNLAYLESVAREVAAAGKPVVIAEFGWYGGGKLTINEGRHPAASEEDQARWCSQVVRATAGLATGWLNWGFYDHPEARDVSQLTGLLTHDGQRKAWGREFKSLASEFWQKAIPVAQLGSRPAMNWDECLASGQARKRFQEDYVRAYAASKLRKDTHE